MSAKRIVDNFIESYKKEFRYVPSIETIARKTGLSFQAVKDAFWNNGTAKKSTKKTRRKKKVDIVIFLIRFVSLSCIIISFRFSLFWVVTFLDPFLAFLLSASLTVYTASAPSIARELFKNKSIVSGFIVSITFMVALVFSIGMTVIGQYNSKIDIIAKNDEKELAINDDREMLIFYKGKKEKENILLLSQIKNKESQELILKNFNETKSQAYRNQQWRVTDARNKIESIKKRIDEIDNKIESILQSKGSVVVKEKNKESFYSFAAKSVKKLKPGEIEFLFYLFPATFIDILAPLGLFLSTNKKKRRK